jgi:hypothetical protein
MTIKPRFAGAAEYYNLNASIRPPRVAVAYFAGDHWQFFATQALRAIAKIWGGAGAVLLPLNADGELLNEDLLPFLRLYDPDYIARFGPTVGEFEQVVPDITETIARRHGMDLPLANPTLQMIRQEKMHVTISAGLMNQLDEWCAPFIHIPSNQQHLREHDIIELGDSAPWGLSPLPIDRNETIYNLTVADADEVTQLFLETRFGFLSPIDPSQITQVDVPQSEALTLFRAAISGETHSRETWVEGLDDEVLLHHVPFSARRQDLVKVSTSPIQHTACVIGDTPQDHALAILCDRIFNWCAWIPPTLLDTPIS